MLNCIIQQRQDRQTETGQTDRQTDRQADRQTDRQTGRQAGRQTGRVTGTLANQPLLQLLVLPHQLTWQPSRHCCRSNRQANRHLPPPVHATQAAACTKDKCRRETAPASSRKDGWPSVAERQLLLTARCVSEHQFPPVRIPAPVWPSPVTPA